MVIPRLLREQAGVAEGITPQLAINRPGPPRRNNRKRVLHELAAAVAELRKDAKNKGLDKMPLSEIDRAVAAARRGLKKNTKRASG